MKKVLYVFATLLLFTGAMSLTSCIKRDDYNATPSGYRYVFNDDFNYDNNGWGFNDPGNNAYASVYNGTYKLSFLASGNGTYSSTIPTGANFNYDFLVQTSIKSDNAMGLVFGASSSSYGYSFFIDDRGYFALYDEGTNSSGATTLLNWQYSSAIRAGWNDIEIEQHGYYWTGYINNVKAFEIQAQPVYGSKCGYIVLANTTGYADYLTVRW